MDTALKLPGTLQGPVDEAIARAVRALGKPHLGP
jgi:hypothetical protein